MFNTPSTAPAGSQIRTVIFLQPGPVFTAVVLQQAGGPERRIAEGHAPTLAELRAKLESRSFPLPTGWGFQ
ncbi:MAG: hypothetical protein V4739_04720 [Pseudomonadota bacterium]